MNDHKYFKYLEWIISGFLLFSILIFMFGFGVWVGQKRAEFSFRWAENYHRNFGGPAQGMMGNFPTMDFTSGHGLYGFIININGNMLVVKGQDDVEKNVIITPNVTIRSNSKDVKFFDLRVGDSIVVIGSPNEEGQIEAKFIRLLPRPSVYLYRKSVEM